MTTTFTKPYSSSRGYDNVGNVTSVDTTLTAGTDNQVFCYDAFNRLVWAGSTGAPSCGGSISAGTLTGAAYSQTMSYDPIGRLSSLSTNGAYTYGDVNHTHAVTSIGSVYQATYDAAGDMTCRAPNSGATCTGGSPNGQTMIYDALRQLAHWQNVPSSPTTQDDFLYDGGGQRIEQEVNVSGVKTTTAYLLGGVEERASSGTITKYLGVSGLPTAIRVGTSGQLNYLAQDGLGSMSEAFDASGNETAAQLYTPYGTVRYATGTMPTAKGFTGQRADVTTGLDYYGARYYDASAGQFVCIKMRRNGEMLRRMGLEQDDKTGDAFALR